MLRLLIVLMLAVVLASCGGEEEGEQETTGTPPTEQRERPPGIQMLTEGLSELEKAVDARITPYFDEAGTQTEIEVAAGEYFELYVFGEFVDLYATRACEYKVVLPPAVSIMSSTHTDSMILSVGKAEEDFMIAFHCLPGPKHMIAKYNCKAHEEFQGGEVEIVKGQNMDFLGFTLCDAENTMIRGKGGKAAIRKK